MLFLIVPALMIVNAATVIAFASDKRRATRGEWRVRESTLLGLALCGGSPGAFWARRRFRHKTHKQPFSTTLELIAMLQSGVVLGLGWLKFTS